MQAPPLCNKALADSRSQDRDWATMVIDEAASFPKGRFKDLTDSTTQALRWLRQSGLIHRRDEITAALAHFSYK